MRMPQHAAVGLFRPPLAFPLLAEAHRADTDKALENYLAELNAYCNAMEARHDEQPLSEDEFELVFHLRQTLNAAASHDTQTTELLAYYRQALTAGQQLAAAQVPTLAQALRPDWESIAMRCFEKLALHLPPREPSELEKRIHGFLDQPSMQARAALPLDHRRALAGITSHDLAHESGTPRP